MAQKIIKSDDLKGHIKDDVSPKVRVDVTDFVGEKGGVINREVLNASGKATQMLEEVQGEVNRLKKEAGDVLSQAKVEKEQEKKRGFETGRNEAMASVTEKAMKLQRLKEEFVRQAEPSVIKLVMEIVEKIVGKMAAENEEMIKSVVRQALESSIGERILVRLHPEDYEVVTRGESEFKDILDRTQRLSFKKDDTVAKGGCVVETEIGTIDAQLDTQLKAIKKALEL